VKKYEEAILAFVAGYVDTLGFVALFGLFTAHVTGNFVLIGAEIAGVGAGRFAEIAGVSRVYRRRGIGECADESA
jgi:uncharacterized membrane protein YoaK (UPF0700 family)